MKEKINKLINEHLSEYLKIYNEEMKKDIIKDIFRSIQCMAEEFKAKSIKFDTERIGLSCGRLLYSDHDLDNDLTDWYNRLNEVVVYDFPLPSEGKKVFQYVMNSDHEMYDKAFREIRRGAREREELSYNNYTMFYREYSDGYITMDVINTRLSLKNIGAEFINNIEDLNSKIEQRKQELKEYKSGKGKLFSILNSGDSINKLKKYGWEFSSNDYYTWLGYYLIIKYNSHDTQLTLIVGREFELDKLKNNDPNNWRNEVNRVTKKQPLIILDFSYIRHAEDDNVSVGGILFYDEGKEIEFYAPLKEWSSKLKSILNQ